MGFLDELGNERPDVFVAGLWFQGLIGRNSLAVCGIGQRQCAEQQSGQPAVTTYLNSYQGILHLRSTLFFPSAVG
jgi:hypothetical protein